jgi:hypothetical protein
VSLNEKKVIMKNILLYYIGLPLICLSSAYSFYFLNTTGLQLTSKAVYSGADKKTVVRTFSPHNESQILIIESDNEQDSSRVVLEIKKELKSREINAKGYLPDVELLKFFIEKGKEGLPVLSIGKYLPFFNN